MKINLGLQDYHFYSFHNLDFDMMFFAFFNSQSALNTKEEFLRLQLKEFKTILVSGIQLSGKPSETGAGSF